MPSGCSPRRDASPSSITTQAEAPSESWEALPAVMNRPCLIRCPSASTGLRAARPSGLVRRRGALLGAERVLVLRLARDAIAVGHDLGRLQHRHVELRHALLEPRV